MFIDTHAHLSYPEFANELPQVIARAHATGVTRIVSIATDLSDARRVLAIAGQYAGVFAAVGLHPTSVPNGRLNDMQEVAQLAGAKKVVAIGETGLDYYRDAKDNPALQQQQKDLFWAHLTLAKECHLPVVIHNRSAEGDLLEILRVHATMLPKEWRPWGVLHCFAGNSQVARECVALGLLISFTGILTFKNADTLRAVAATVPLNHTLLETDAPYLAPVPHRGKRNEPAFIPHIAEVLAQVKGVTIEAVARTTTAAAKQLFQIE